MGRAGSGIDPATIKCGDTIDQDVALVHNLTCSGDGLVLSNGATLDLNGHKIRGDGTGTGVRIVDFGNENDTHQGDDVLSNGTIAGFDTGVYLRPATSRVEHLTIKGNTTYGIFVEGNPPGANSGIIKRNRISNNGTGIYFGPGGGLRMQLLNNDIGNNSQGVFTSHDSDGMLVQGNKVHDNTGIGFLDDTSVMRVIDNTFNGNGGDGLLVREDVPTLAPAYLIKDNKANANGGHGIEVAIAGIPDGGGNKAGGNLTDPQCVGIVCKS
jgi:hypothetical protein